MKKSFIKLIIVSAMTFFSTVLFARDMEMNAVCSCIASPGQTCSCSNDEIHGWREKITPSDVILVNVSCGYTSGGQNPSKQTVEKVVLSGDDISCQKNKAYSDPSQRQYYCRNTSLDATHYVHATSIVCKQQN